jgi:pimeloyl-ACP methyl ester carboxylesterase
VVAFWAASVAPELVGEVVAVDGVPFASALMNPSAVVQDMEPFAEKMRAVYHALTAEQLAAQTRIALAGMISNPAQIELAVEWAKRSSPATKAFASNASRLDLILKAYEDQVALVPRHRVVAAAQALHFVMLDDPSFLLAAMDDFLNGRRLQ